MYECENDNKSQVDLQLNSYKCALLNDFEVYNVHTESAEIDKWSILNTKIDYMEYNIKELKSNRVRFSSTEGNCQKGYRQLQTEVNPVKR